MAMFENFPYTDMHNLNLDWIIKIAKDFLDQYTHIQQLISDGETSLQNLTEEGLQQLSDKADELEGLLNSWYSTHSEDIANQLASALSDLNAWYTLHSGYLDNILNENIAAFDTHAVAKAEETIESIPADYTSVATEVYNMDKVLFKKTGENDFVYGSAWNLITNDFYPGGNSGYVLIPRYMTNEYLKIISAYGNRNAPVVCYFSDLPSQNSFISSEGRGETGDPTLFQNVTCSIPSTCKYIIIQSAYFNLVTPVFEVKTRCDIVTDYFDNTHNHLIARKIWSKVANNWYNSNTYSSLIIPVDMVNGFLQIERCTCSNAIPPVVYFSGYPEQNTRIGYEFEPPTGDDTAIRDKVCTIPTNCKYILIQAKTGSVYRFNFYKDIYKENNSLENITRPYIKNITYNRLISGYYPTQNSALSVIKRSDIGDLLYVEKAGANANTANVVYFSGIPAPATYISHESLGSTGEVEEVNGHLCTIPTDCKYIILQGFYIDNTTPKFIAEMNTLQKSLNTETDKQIWYAIINNEVYLTSNYGTEKIGFTFGKRGVNNIPDFMYIEIKNAFKYTSTTDWFAPYMVKARENIDGDNALNIFTGGNHNYNGYATASNKYFRFYADNKELSGLSNHFGTCNEFKMAWKNGVQAFNTVKNDGTGREVLTETYELTFDGTEFSVYTIIEPLELVELQRWYGYQMHIPSYPYIIYTGCPNSEEHLKEYNPTSGNANPNMMTMFDENNKAELEINRPFDLGRADAYEGTSGMFVSAEKAYCYIIYNQLMAAYYKRSLKGWYRFSPK